jgi:hypothetical protein
MISMPASAQDELRIWEEFVSSVKKGGITAERVRPYSPAFTVDLIRWLKMVGEEMMREERDPKPEVFRVGDQINYVIPLGQSTFCFTILIEGGSWYFRHMENIFVRLDKVDSLPASKFPDVSEEQKAWAREEIYWSGQVRLFNLLLKEKGREFALSWFKDGAGYFMGARTWVPFVAPARAFVLYLCWDQANLRGNKVVLEKLEDSEAVLRLESPIYFALYEHTSHLKRQISFDDYRAMFEAIWKDRAANAGWNLEITYKESGCVFKLSRSL